jgi:hypothetical protein
VPADPCHLPLPASARNADAVERNTLPGTLPSAATSGARDRLLLMLHDGQGTIRCCQADLGRALGVSRARARQLLSELAAAGAVKVRTSSAGTVIRLAEPMAGAH